LLVVVAVIAQSDNPRRVVSPMLRRVIGEVGQQRDTARTERSNPV
jgi:hypothetical protein